MSCNARTRCVISRPRVLCTGGLTSVSKAELYLCAPLSASLTQTFSPRSTKNPLIANDAPPKARLVDSDLRIHECSETIEQTRSSSFNATILPEIRVFSDLPAYNFSSRYA